MDTHIGRPHIPCVDYMCDFRGTSKLHLAHVESHQKEWEKEVIPTRHKWVHSAMAFCLANDRLHPVELQLLDFIFLIRGGTFKGAANIIQTIMPHWYADVLTRAMESRKERWLKMDLRDVEGLCEELQGLGLLDEEAIDEYQSNA